MILAERLIIFLFAFSSSYLSAIDVSVTTLNYLQEEAYIEIYSRIMGSSVQFSSKMLEDTLMYSQIELLVTIRAEEKIAVAEKYLINSPATSTTIDFWDLKRYVLPNGDYQLELQYVDINNVKDTTFYKETIVVNHSTNYLSTSDLLLLKDISKEQNKYPFSKAGFYFEPATYNLFGSSDQVFMFYMELYNYEAKVEDGLYYRFQLRDSETHESITKPAYRQVKDKAQIFEKFDIEDIPSGNYQLNFELVNKSREVLHQVLERFSVHHPLTDYKQRMSGDAAYETSFVQLLDEGELNYALKAIFPRIGNNMSGLLNDIIWGEELDPKRYFLYSFWSKFSLNNSKEIFDKYMEVARAVDLSYANNVGHGFETDRGYYFLKYGKPDDVISVEDEPSAPPYEIWIYNYLEETQQTAVKFLFYNPSIVSNDYILLHSTCRGEVSNPRWEIKLYEDDNFDNTENEIDRTNAEDGLNRNARRYFTDF